MSRQSPRCAEGPGLISEGPISLFKVTDPDGNILEYYALSTPINGL